MRLGILGGTFDPIHFGHLLLAETCREQLQLEAVWFLPAAVPPHKRHVELTPGQARIEMIELAIAGHQAFAVCPYEVERGGVNYTADTLDHLNAEDPSRALYFLMGADSLGDLPTWKDPKRVLSLAVPVVVARGDSRVDFDALSPLVDPERLETIRRHQIQMPRIELAASDLRSRVAQGRSIRYRTPRSVEKYIETHGLYQA